MINTSINHRIKLMTICDYIDSIEVSPTPVRDIHKIKKEWNRLCMQKDKEKDRGQDWSDLFDEEDELLRHRMTLYAKDPKFFIKCIRECKIRLVKLSLILEFDPNTVYNGKPMLSYVFDLPDSYGLEDTLYFFGADVNILEDSASLLKKTIKNSKDYHTDWLITKGVNLYQAEKSFEE